LLFQNLGNLRQPVAIWLPMNDIVRPKNYRYAIIFMYPQAAAWRSLC
jgi:hypothetical protein